MGGSGRRYSAAHDGTSIVSCDRSGRRSRYRGAILRELARHAGHADIRRTPLFHVRRRNLAVYDPRADGDARAPRPNFDHVYFAVDDLEAVYRRAQQAGGLSTEIGDGGLPMGEIARRPWGERSFYLHDPFGNPLCFVDEASIFKG
jgi:catechol 2,3-dioxygenase-like lactoylglutathione lyase family enzyme